MKRVAVMIFLALILGACSKVTDSKNVTVYVSEDQVFSEPLLKAFEKETGIHVKAVYDSEESKSTGVMNRLIAEKANPQADVYWANEPIRAEVLRKKGILAPYKSPNAAGIESAFLQKEYYWSGFSARLRLFIVSDKSTKEPSSVFDYANAAFRNSAVIANPLFGTTTAHIAALFSTLGDAKMQLFLKNIKQNGVAVATSNGESADLVASGKYLFALVDSDDVASRLKRGEKVHVVYPDQRAGELGIFVVPNAVMLLAHAKHPKAAKKLIDYLLSKESEERLAKAACAQIPLHKGVKAPPFFKPIEQLHIMHVDYAEVAQRLMQLQPSLKEWLAK